jgi:cob(I)alamin adenosyltransferase
MLYTRKGDDGKTQTFGCNQKLSKSSAVAEALGTLDEINSFLGIIKAKAPDAVLREIIHRVQENLFIIQAEVAGADKIITEDKIIEIEKIVDEIERELPPIKTFFISGATGFSAELDFARTLARRAERRVVGVVDEGLVKISSQALAYLNRLSSLLYALARQSAYKSGINEVAPDYK